jgi:DNA-binding NarL/FixJ family response regulator
VRVLVVGDDPLALGGLAAMLGSEPGLQVTGQTSPGDDLMEAASRNHPHVALWDLGPGSPSDLEPLRDFERSGLPALALLPHGESAAQAFAAGARGLLRRDSDATRLAAALRAVAQGIFVLDELSASSMLPALSPAAVPIPLVEALTPREHEVLDLLAQGLANKTIADRLAISEHTAKFHVNAILGKLGVESRTEAVVRAVRLGLVVL